MYVLGYGGIAYLERRVLKKCCINTVRSLDTNFIAGGVIVVCKECNHEIPMLTANEILEDKNKDRGR